MSDSSFLEYLFETHRSQLNKPSDYLALLCHAMLLDRKAKLKNGKAILPENWNQTDPIRLFYVTEDGVDVNVSVVETAGDAFVSVTESKHDRLGHLEVPVDDYVDLAPGLSLERSYPQLAELKTKFEDHVWSVIFPRPAPVTPGAATTARPSCQNVTSDPLRRSNNPLMDNRFVSAFDYGRRDLDPFGGIDPLRPGQLGPIMGGGPGGLGGGGMLFDPRRPYIDDRPLYPGAPPEAAPPGARIDPILPFPSRNPNRGRGGPRPDPDMPTPPGWEDMYL